MSTWPNDKSTEPTNTEAVEIICIIDRSGSMASMRSDAIGGFNTFLDAQKALPGDANLTMVMFNTSYEVVHERAPLAGIDRLTDAGYVPVGGTALLDAIGKTLDGKDYGSKGIVAIITDGEENSSSKFSKGRIAELIAEYETKGWEVHYMGAHADAFDEAGGIGIGKHRTHAFAHSGQGIGQSYMAMSLSAADYRSRTTKDTSTDDTDDKN